MTEPAHVTVVLSTYNRRDLLITAIKCLLERQNNGPAYEVIVVDNNSTDGTKDSVAAYADMSAGRLRYIEEPRQGVSYARNAGITAARGRIIAFADDDVQVMPGWIAAIERVFQKHPDVDFIGGKVLPLWGEARPDWITRDHWMPLALLDYGDTPFLVSEANPLCLLSANLAVRREAFNKAGLFAPELQRVKNGIGSMEDHELQVRFFRAGCVGLYAPEITVTAEVPPERMKKAYHRRWHAGHGHFYALMWSQSSEPRSALRLLDVPGYIYRQAFKDGVAWLKALLQRDVRALAHEMKLHFALGFVRTRIKAFFGG